ncbi:hypothetical protein BGZ76_009858 [Entomortierella beljakovae]|nr:hypothetical protein BGZ76_009858 [Entomortierella beljakovae]
MVATIEQKRIFLASFHTSLGRLGLDVVHPFPAQSFNATELGQQNPLHTFNQSSTLTFIIGNTKTFWDTFLAQHDPSKLVSEAEKKDPMDHYCERLIPIITLNALNDAGLYSNKEGQELTTDFSVAFSHWRVTVPAAGTPPPGSKPTGFVPPPTKVHPIQQVAHAAGLAHLCRLAYLSVHPVYGPWFAMRSIVSVDLPYDISDNEMLLIRDEKNLTGTYSVDSKPIEENPAFRDITQEQIDERNSVLEATKNILLTKGWDARDWKEWVAFRQSLTVDRPDWQAWRYSDNQMRYHYQKEQDLLAECSKKYQEEHPQK